MTIPCERRLRSAVRDLARDGCDLADPAIDRHIRADDAAFHLGYLEERCGSRLAVAEVVAVARRMAAAVRRRQRGDGGGGSAQPPSR